MKARTLILTVGAIVALGAPVAQAAGKNALQCSASARAAIAKSAKPFYNPLNPRGTLSASTCKGSTAAKHSVATSGLAVSKLGTDAGQASQLQNRIRISTPVVSAPVAPLPAAVAVAGPVDLNAGAPAVETDPDLSSSRLQDPYSNS